MHNTLAMARPTKITREKLAPLIRARGPVSATELAAVLRVNRTTIVRVLADFGDELVTMGATRSTRYALRRPVGNAGNRWPIYAVDESGRARLRAELEALHERHWRILWVGTPPAWADRFANREGLWEGFPFFLSDARPQGFLGRAIAMQISRSLPVPDEPRRWSDDDTLGYLQAASEDLPGSHVVGDDCLRRALARSVFPESANLIDVDERATRYPEMARLAASALPGTSAGGEQPKFLTTLRNGPANFHPVLVKFSPPMDQAAGQRWAEVFGSSTLRPGGRGRQAGRGFAGIASCRRSWQWRTARLADGCAGTPTGRAGRCRSRRHGPALACVR